MINELPIYKIKDKFYFLNKRLNEYRNIKNPFDVLRFEDVSLSDLQKPNTNDINELNQIREKGINNNKKVRELNKIPFAERII